MEYFIYSDESYSTAARYRSIAAISFPASFKDEISEDLGKIVDGSNLSHLEFKWNNLKTKNTRNCAKGILDYFCNNITDKSIRIDVLIWDTQDSRHKIQGRDDRANFERMFYHLTNNLMKRREKDSSWYIHPDERLDINWSTIHDCLKSSGKWRKYLESRLFRDEISEQFYSIMAFEQVNSIEQPCCQAADLFSGMAVYTKNKYQEYKEWCACEDPQMCLFDPPSPPAMSIRDKMRFPVIKCLIDKCRGKGFGVSIDKKECLYTFNPKNPINFWHYAPQHDYDKAPTRHSL